MKLLLFVFALIRINCLGQLNRTDTLLYIYFDKGNSFDESKALRSTTKVYKNGIYTKFEHDSGFHTLIKRTITPPDTYYFKDTSFVGCTKDGYDRMEPSIIKLKALKKFPVVTYSQLQEFLKSNYKERNRREFMDTTIYIEPPPRDPLGVVSFWIQLKHIYIVEKDLKKKVAIITEVKLDEDRE
jgi:hypothetical protein